MLPGTSVGRILRSRAGLVEWVALFLLALGFATVLLTSRIAEPLDAVVYDSIVRATPSTPDDRILIVAIDDASLRATGRWPWRRDVHAALIDRLTAAGARAIAYDVLFVDPAAGDDALGAATRRAPRLALPLLVEAPGDNGAAFRETRPVVASVATGHVLVRTDRDGVFRNLAPVERIGTRSWQHLAVATAKLAGVTPDFRRTLIPFAGPPGSYSTVSASAVRSGEVPPELLRDRIVLVGATAAGLGDRFATPVGSEADLMAGIEVQANAVDALLNGRMRALASTAVALAFAAVALAVLWAGFLFASPRMNIAIAILLLGAIVGVAAVMLTQADLWVRPAAVLITLVVMFPLWGWRRLAAASRFLDAELARLDNPDMPTAGGDRIARQMALLSAARVRIERLRDQREQTLAFLSHDLRGPAAAILGIVPGDGRVAGHARRLLRLADQFVHGLRAEDAPLIRDQISLSALLDEATDQCWEAAQRVGGRVEVSCADTLPEIVADHALMARAVVNLVDNALSHGGERPVVHVRGWVRDGQAIVTVADAGAGLTHEKTETLFAAYQAGATRRSAGTGLGLALVATFARRHEGEVRCISRVGVGSLFELSIPAL